MDIRADSELLSRLMTAASLRSEVISGNISNQNTPGYTRQVVRFEELLREGLLKDPSSAPDLRPTIGLDSGTPAGPDGNNVSLELEINSARENRLLYETYATILEGHFRTIEAAIMGGR